MRKVNIRQLHEKTGTLIDAAAEGHVIVVLRRGIAVAEIRPLGKEDRRKTLPEREALLARYPRIRGDSGRFLEEDRS